MNLQIKELRLKDFQGIKRYEAKFDKETTFQGRNEAGKTTLNNAWNWLLFGKDSNFNELTSGVVPRDAEGSRILNITSSVIGVLGLDGSEIKLTKTYTENEKTNRNGDTTIKAEILYYIDDLPVKYTDYNKKIEEITDLETFKLLASPTYFSEKLKWQERRAHITGLIGEISINDIAQKKVYSEIKEDVIKYNPENCKIKWSAEKKKTDEKVLTHETRIDENNLKILNIEEPKEIHEQIKELEKERDSLYDEQRNFESKRKQKISNRMYEHDSIVDQISNKENKIKNTKQNIEDENKEIKRLEIKNESTQKEINSIEEKKKLHAEYIEKHNKKIDSLRSEYVKIKSSDHSEDIDNICPTCRQELPDDMVKEASEKHEKAELKKIIDEVNFTKQQIKNLGVGDFVEEKKELLRFYRDNVSRMESIKELISEKLNEIIKIEKEIQALSVNAVNIKDSIEEIKKEEQIDHSEQIELITNEVIKLNGKVGNYRESENAKRRKTELEKELEIFKFNSLQLQKKLDLLSKLNKDYIESVSDSVNKLFNSKLKFRMFIPQKNGGYKDDCEVMIKSREKSLVPYNQANTGGKANAGIQIVDTLQKLKKIFLPIWVDNTESVDEVYSPESQIIKLEKVKSATTLRKK